MLVLLPPNENGDGLLKAGPDAAELPNGPFEGAGAPNEGTVLALLTVVDVLFV